LLVASVSMMHINVR